MEKEKTKTETWQGRHSRGAWEWLEESPEHVRDQREWAENVSQEGVRPRLTKPAQVVPMAAERDLRQAKSLANISLLGPNSTIGLGVPRGLDMDALGCCSERHVCVFGPDVVCG